MRQASRRPRSPFRRMSRADLQMFRRFAAETERWKRAAAAERYYMLPYAWQIQGNSGGLYQTRVLNAFESRALNYLAGLPNWPAIREQRRVEYLRQFDSQAYEAHRLCQEVASLRTKVNALTQQAEDSHS